MFAADREDDGGGGYSCAHAARVMPPTAEKIKKTSFVCKRKSIAAMRFTFESKIAGLEIVRDEALKGGSFCNIILNGYCYSRRIVWD